MSWQKVLAQGFSCSRELLEFLSLPLTLASTSAESLFKTRVPLGFAKRMQPGNPSDPLLLQVLAVHEESLDMKGYSSDPLLEKKYLVKPGLMHKYHGRVLLLLTGACAIHCRYCFRRHFSYQEHGLKHQTLEDVFAYIQNDCQIQEVILSGGDPLLMNDASLSFLLQALSKIKHIKTIRFHSRVPIVLPERIDDAFLQLLRTVALEKIIVVHSNHPQEWDDSVHAACYGLRQQGCHLLNQSVLLKGVNDNVATLANLSEQLLKAGVLPYYLHVLDKIKGAAHFDLSKEQALTIYRALQKRLPGYLLPRLVCEEPGKESKTLLI